MDFDWRFHLGDVVPPYETGHGHVYGAAKAGGAIGAARADWDDTDWERVDLPHDWCVNLDFDQEARPDHGYKRRGVGWYRKQFLLDESFRGSCLQILFDGISTHATVYFNGSVVARNWCGYTGFYVDIGDMVCYGNRPNTLAIRVDAQPWEGWWYEGAGIYRHVTMIATPPLHFDSDGIHVDPIRIGETIWDTRIAYTVCNTTDSALCFDAISVVLDGDGRESGLCSTSHRCDAYKTIRIEQSVRMYSPSLWDLDSPNLYTLVSRIVASAIPNDEVRTTFGYRAIRIDPETGFHLNGRHVVLKGTCNHQDHAGIGTAMLDNMHEYRIRRLQEMGCNACRCAHNPPAPEFLAACDRLGMLVMDENRNFDSSQEGIRQLRCMVLQARNHPSVVMYSLCNEEPLQGTDMGRRIAIRLLREVKELDGSRPVLTAMNGGLFENEGMALSTDITGLNYMLEQMDRFHISFPNQPVLASENCCVYSTRGEYRTDRERRMFSFYDDEMAPWGESIRKTWKTVCERGFIMGMFLWTGFDYRGEPSPYEWPAVNSQFGAMDTCGFVKGPFHLLRSLWTDEPVLQALPSWSDLPAGTDVRMITITNGDEVEIYLNGKRIGRKRSDPFKQLEWQIPFEPGILHVLAYRDGKTWAEFIGGGSGAPHSIRLERVSPVWQSGRADAEIVDVTIVDAEGRVVQDAMHHIRFTVHGAGTLAGVGNGDPTCHDLDAGPWCHAFHGRCQAILRRRSEGGILLHATSNGLMEATLDIGSTGPKSLTIIPSIQNRFIVNWRMYQKVLPQHPDPSFVGERTDMNTWEAIQLGTGPQRALDGASGYAMYRGEVRLKPEERRRDLIVRFHEVLGYVEVYANGALAVVADRRWGGGVDAPIAWNRDNELSGTLSLTVILRCTDAGPRSGLCGSVSVTCRPA